MSTRYGVEHAPTCAVSVLDRRRAVICTCGADERARDAVTWTKRTTGFGTTEYTATIDGVNVVAKRTGGRHVSWELRTDTWPRNERITSGSRLRSIQELAESSVASWKARQA